jgi:hypothetical protein
VVKSIRESTAQKRTLFDLKKAAQNGPKWIIFGQKRTFAPRARENGAEKY